MCNVVPATRQQARGLEQRQAHDAGVAAVDALDPGRDAALHRIGAGLAEGFAAGHVALDAELGQLGHANARDAHFDEGPAPGTHRHRGQHAVRAARQQPQRGRRFLGVARLAQDAPAGSHRGVGAQDRGRRQPPPQPPPARRLQLGQRDALHVIGRHFAGAFRFQCFHVFGGVGQQRPVRQADLVEQLAPPRAGRGQVDEGGQRHACIVYAPFRAGARPAFIHGGRGDPRSATRRGTALRPAARARRRAAASGRSGAGFRRPWP